MMFLRGFSLQPQYSGEDVVGHGESSTHAYHPRQTPAGLRQWCYICYCVEKTRPYKQAEVEHSGGKLWSCQSVEQANQHKGNNVLQVILMASGDTKQSSFSHNRHIFDCFWYIWYTSRDVRPSHTFHVIIDPQHLFLLLRSFGQVSIFNVCKCLFELKRDHV